MISSNTTRKIKKLIFKNLPKEYERIIATIEDVFDSIIDSDSEPQDYIFFQLNHNSFEQGVLTIPCETAAKLRGSKILYKITRALNSNTELDVTKYLDIMIGVKRMPAGSCRSLGKKENAFDRYLKNKSSVKKIRNNDNLCAFRAIIIERAYQELPHEEAAKIARPGSSTQTKYAQILAKMINFHGSACEIHHLQEIETFIPYQIIVIDGDRFGEF